MTNMNTVSHGGTRVYEGMTDEFDDLKAQKKEIAEQREAIKNNPNLSDSEKNSLLADLDRAEAAIDQALDFTTSSGKYDTTTGNRRNDGDLAAVHAALGRAEAMMARVDSELNASAPSSQSVSQPRRGRRPATTARGSSKADSAGSTNQAGSSSGSSGLGAMEFNGKSVDQMINLMNNDPKALMDHLGSIKDPEEKQMAMKMIMQRLQEINQMFSMMSNMMKSMHDTAKAAINNMRV
ncbi:hypothetical protein FIV42_27100 [Persicimonas caeni]|uniref:Uncharacterized protein n=1 Tax=Persicimonas caeni TaxID=2292766 RepID=A0A4Y6Q1F5_PERCE|nr:hypothetical protein [Persicimonas caeni]QDG54279.1 hypothetical protein FIV42_27100 [Persicimonas caeni]QED35500.1 hypothetical protein FRD00_27095 [Persicimonas caeni]